MTFTVSNSKVKSWRHCRQQHWYRYVENLTDISPPRPLIRGKVIHEMIEAWLEHRDPWVIHTEMVAKYYKLFKEEQEQYGDLPAVIKDIMTGYFKWYKNDPFKIVPLKGKQAEHYFNLSLTPSINIQGYIDAAGKTRDKRFWLIEHKSHKTIPSEGFRYRDIQSAIYCWVLPLIGFPKPDGVMWNFIREKSPTVPHLLKNGELSRAKSIDTTWDTYKAEIKLQGLKIKDYEDMQLILAGKETDFFSRLFLPTNDTIINTLIGELRSSAREIKRKGHRSREKTVGMHCDWCEFRDLCKAELMGLDTDYIRKTKFKERTKLTHGKKNKEKS